MILITCLIKLLIGLTIRKNNSWLINPAASSAPEN